MNRSKNSFFRQIKHLGEYNLKDGTSNGRTFKVQVRVCMVSTGPLGVQNEKLLLCKPQLSNLSANDYILFFSFFLPLWINKVLTLRSSVVISEHKFIAF